MAWHMRLWRRVKVMPGVSLNFSKSGASVSLGPRGSKVTFGRRGVRQTIGIPGTGIYATRLIRPGSGAPTTAQPPAATPGQVPEIAPALAPASMTAAAGDGSIPADDRIEIYYGLATFVGIAIGIVLFAAGVSSNMSIAAGLLATVIGIVYEGLAHHHPAIPSRLSTIGAPHTW